MIINHHHQNSLIIH